MASGRIALVDDTRFGTGLRAGVHGWSVFMDFPPAIAQRLCCLNSQVELRVLEDVAHYPQLEAADTVAITLLAAPAELEQS